MNIVITMGGLGFRFQKAGYTVPKYQIEVKGKTLFEWSMISMDAFKKEREEKAKKGARLNGAKRKVKWC